MEFKTTNMKRCELVSVSGQIDSVQAPEFEQELLGLIQAGTKNMVLNLAEVTFISSAGLRSLISAQIKVRRMVPRGEVVLSEVPSQLKGTLELVGFHHLFRFFDSDAEAVGIF
jgi:anti-sigma B factor antagonist